MDGPDDTSWCRACGVPASQDQTTACASCGVSLAAPQPGNARVGVVVKLSGGLLTKLGIALSSSAGRVLVIGKGDDGTLTTQEFDELERVAVDGPEVVSAAGRLMVAYYAVEARRLKGKWDATRVSSEAFALANADVGSRRAAVADWLALGIGDWVDALELSADEASWARALFAARRGDLTVVLESLLRLPATGYAARVDLLVGFATQFGSDLDQRHQVAQLAQPFIDDDPVAHALAVAIGSTTRDEKLRVTQRVLTSDVAIDRLDCDELLRIVTSVVDGGSERPNEPALYPATQALAVYRGGCEGEPIDDEAGWLSPAGLALYDDLIDAGALSAAALTVVEVPNDSLNYLTARIDPSRLSVAKLESLGPSAELARRYYLEGDAGHLGDLAGDSEDAAHYAALLRLRGDVDAHRDGLRANAILLLAKVDEFRSALAADEKVVPAPEVLRDGSCWRLFRDAALGGRIWVSPDTRECWPRFSAWLDFCEMQACAFGGDWVAVRDLGEKLLQRIEDELVRDEIQNMAAYAQFQMGNHHAAMDLLNSALAGSHTGALVVNASIVASQLGSEFAASFLARVFDESPDPEIGIRALMRGMELWLADPDSKTLPVAITSTIQNALSRPMSDASLRTLLEVASIHDTDWLAAGPPISLMSPEQVDLMQYYQVRARSRTANYSETLTDVARTLVSILGRGPRPEWATDELARLVALLSDLVHVEFGQAPNLFGPIDVLVDARVLSLREELVLAAQAGAHLSVHFENENETVSEQAEQRFLLGPVARYCAERSNLPDDVRAAVGRELARCMAVSAIAIVSYTEKRWAEVSRAWDALVSREKWDHQNRAQILRQEAALLDAFAVNVIRCNSYDKALRQLELDSAQQDIADTMRREIDDWTGTLARLRSFL